MLASDTMPGVGFVFQPMLVAAQAHSSKQDRAVVISARNFIRALGGSAGLAIASAIFSNILLESLPASLPQTISNEIRKSIFDMPNIDDLSADQQQDVKNAYVKAARSVFYLWVGAMGMCLLLMLLVKDRGLNRQEEPKPQAVDDSAGVNEAATISVKVSAQEKASQA
jgi:hypothetical protein